MSDVEKAELAALEMTLREGIERVEQEKVQVEIEMQAFV